MKRVEAESFIDGLRKSVDRRDHRAIAELTAFPLRRTSSDHGSSIEIENEKDLEEHFDSIFTEDVVRALRSQSIEDISDSWRGVMIGQGEIWFSSFCVGPDETPCEETEIFLVKIGNWTRGETRPSR